MKRISFSVKKFAVDRDTGTLRDLALVVAGREAKGHGIYIDAKTLQGGLDSVVERGGLLRGAVCHETFDQWWNDEDRLLEVPGYFSDISITGNTLRAGSFQFYDSFKADQPEAYRRLMEMAEKTPTLFGLSIEAGGYAVYVDAQGNEYSQRPEDTDLAYDGLPAFRITDLNAAAFVSDPAATDGLFAKAMSAVRSGQKLGKRDAALLGEAFAAWATEHDVQLSEPGRAGQSNQENQNTDPMKKLLQALKEKFGNDEARYNRAVLFAANHDDPDTLTVEVVLAALEKAELQDLRQENADLQSKLKKAAEAGDQSEEVKNLNSKLADLQKEKDAAEKRFQSLKESGHDTELSTGAPAIVGTGYKFSGVTDNLIQLGTIPGNMVDSLKKKFAAGTTSVSDLWVPEILTQGMAERTVERPIFMQSGAVTGNDDITRAATAGGQQVSIKHFVEPYFDSLLQSESTAPTKQKIASGSQVAATLRRVSPLSVSSFAGAVSNSDPFGFILNILGNLRDLQDQTTLINALRGFLGTAGASLSEDNFTEDVAGDGTSGKLITDDMIADAVARLGEVAEVLESGAMIVHSTVHAALKKADLISYIRSSENGRLLLRTYQGIPLFISDKCTRAGTTDGSVYETYILGPGTIGRGTKPQSGNVGDTASLLIDEQKDTNDLTAYDRRQFILHPAGAKWTGTPSDADAGPTDAELATAGNWGLGYSNVKRCGFVRIRTNG